MTWCALQLELGSRDGQLERAKSPAGCCQERWQVKLRGHVLTGTLLLVASEANRGCANAGTGSTCQHRS